MTALHLAIAANFKDVTLFILSSPLADVNIGDVHGKVDYSFFYLMMVFILHPCKHFLTNKSKCESNVGEHIKNTEYSPIVSWSCLSHSLIIRHRSSTVPSLHH